MKIRNVFFGLVVIFCFVFGILACSNGQTDKRLIGNWDNGGGNTFEFTKSKIIANGYQFNYKIEKGAIYTGFGGAFQLYADNYEFIDKDTLKMSLVTFGVMDNSKKINIETFSRKK